MKKYTEYLKTEEIAGRNQATFIGNECKIYIPDDYFQESIAELNGVLCETLGIFYFRVDGELHMLKLPLMIQFQYLGQPERVQMVLKPGMQSLKYKVFTLKSGCAFIWDLNREEGQEIMEILVKKFLESGKWPKIIPYNEFVDLTFKCYQAANKPADVLNAPSTLVEMLISNSCRYKNDVTKPMRLAYNGKNAYDFTPVRLTRVTSTISTLNAIMGEDMTKQLIASVLRTREHVEEPESPIEKVIKY